MTTKGSWITSHALAEYLLAHRNNDIRVDVEGQLIPIIAMEYDANADVICLWLDEDGDEYKMAMIR